MNALKNLLIHLEVEDNSKKLEQFHAYRDEILAWNEKVNLTAITDLEEFEKKHFIDSILPVESLEFQHSDRIIDIGTGAGFPGVPLAILYPKKEFLLVDSLNKRLKIIDEITDKLGIYNVKTIHGRAEELARRKEFRESFDLCVSRAVANLATLSEYCLPFVRPGGTFIAYKGNSVGEEVEAAKRAISLLGGKLDRIEEISKKGKKWEMDFDHTLLFIKKDKKTSKTYPRKAGVPAKTPIK
ncbi:MAG: 16S rRNA (guanine(527)-N(7))-methyltransferase RsmG [Anaerovoracaceae bacterium]